MNQTYSLNMIPGGNPLRVPVRQFDKGSRTITMTLWNGSGAFSVPAGSAVTVEGTKPDGKSFSSAASFSSAGVSFTVTEQMAAVAGDVRCQLTVTKSGTILGSATFLLVVEPSALPENPDLSETVFSSFQQLKNAAQTAASNAATSANAAAASAAEADAYKRWLIPYGAWRRYDTGVSTNVLAIATGDDNTIY